MQEISELLSKPNLTKGDLLELRYLATQGGAEDAAERMMMVDGAVWRIVTDPLYAGDIELSDLEE